MIQIFQSPIIEFIKGKKCVAIFYKKSKRRRRRMNLCTQSMPKYSTWQIVFLCMKTWTKLADTLLCFFERTCDHVVNCFRAKISFWFLHFDLISILVHTFFLPLSILKIKNCSILVPIIISLIEIANVPNRVHCWHIEC